MSLAADALQPFVMRGLFSLSGRTEHSHLADVITASGRAGYDLDFDDAQQRINLDFRDADYVAAAIGGDACRLASAAFVSFSNVPNELQERSSVAWGIVKLYYSAFYAGNGLLRLLGQSCSYLDTSHISRLRQVSVAIGNIPAFTINSGMYHFVLTQHQTGFSAIQARGSVGGAHEAFWKIFAVFVRSLTEQVMLGYLTPRDARDVFLKLSEFQNILILNGSPSSSWLSTIRNDVQYRQEFGVWPPLKIRKRNRETLARLAAQWLRDPMDIDLGLASGSQLEAFVVACAFTVSLCRTLFARIAERSSAGGRSFARHPLVMP